MVAIGTISVLLLRIMIYGRGQGASHGVTTSRIRGLGLT